MKFGLFFLSALTWAASAAPVPDKRSLDFAQRTVSSLMSDVQPMITDLENVLCTAKNAVGGDLDSILATCEHDFQAITSTLLAVTAQVSNYTGAACASGNAVSSTLKQLMTDLNSVISKAESVLGKDRISPSIQPLEIALGSLVSGLICIVINLLTLVQSFVAVLSGDLATTINGILANAPPMVNGLSGAATGTVNSVLSDLL